MTDSSVAIAVSNVSKCYQVFETGRARLLNTIWPSHRSGVEEVWALRDIDFEIRRGESVGVIGRNGGGKSTLLEILTGTLTPTTGAVKVNGRISALLELGSGFNPEYTGRENVMLNGLLLGLSRQDVLRRFDEILAFSEIGDAVERPVKTYSSGMVMRLAFAVQVLTDPDILIIDEALSVGDFFFQQKCFSYIRSLRERGVTLLFVSHDMGTVRDLCNRAVYLKQGRTQFVGASERAIRLYLTEKAATAQVDEPAVAPSPGAGAIPETAFWRRAERGGNAFLLAAEITDSTGISVTHLRIGETLRVRVYFRATEAQAGHITLIFKNRYDQIVSSVSSYTSGLAALSSRNNGMAVFQMEIDMELEAGLYTLQIAFGRPTGKNTGERLDETGWIGPIEVRWDYETDTAPFLGMFGLPARCEVIENQPDQVLSPLPSAGELHAT